MCPWHRAGHPGPSIRVVQLLDGDRKNLFVAFVPRVPVPKIPRKLINDIGAATFYIFIFNGFIIITINYVLHLESRVVIFLIAMTGTMVAW